MNPYDAIYREDDGYDWIDPIDLGGFFGPSDDAERRNADLRERWKEYEKEGVGVKGGPYAHLHRQRQAWYEYTGAWDSGDYDTALPMLQAIEADAEVVRADINARRAKEGAKALERLAGGTLEKASAAYSAGSAIEQGKIAQGASEIAQGAAQAITSEATGLGAGLLSGVYEAIRANPIPALLFVGLVGAGFVLTGPKGRR